jgi:hypothetical protein
MECYEHGFWKYWDKKKGSYSEKLQEKGENTWQAKRLLF